MQERVCIYWIYILSSITNRARIIFALIPCHYPSVISFSDASVVVNKVLEAEDVNWGYDAMVGSYVNMIEAGIIDPTKVR